MEFSYELKIPKERIAIVIGQAGETKKKIEEETNCHLKIDSKEGDIKINGADSLDLFSAKEIVKAIARGFSPQIALHIIKSDYILELLQLQEYVGKSKTTMMRLKGRVIGSEGKTRKFIEQNTETYISVYGKTIAVLGEAENVMIAKRAVESLLAGSNHTSVYRWLEKKKKELERNRIIGKRKIELK